jgi:formimidoylglutamate deiminase
VALRLFASQALLADGWARDVTIEVDDCGRVAATDRGPPAPGVERLAGPVLPGMANLHSHAFQRALAGRTERRAPGGRDSFWTWRQAMYRFVERLTPDTARDVAAWLYLELLKHGYTAVAEFHYVHHAPGGTPYAEPAEMSLAHVCAAAETGIALTLLPVLYAHGGFGDAPLGGPQARFRGTPETILLIAERLRAESVPDLVVGVAAHSLRAVTPAELAALEAGLNRIDPRAPLHIHVAEQVKEVEDCLAWSGRRPVAWLLDHAPLGPRWCLVHCTHIDASELARLAASGAVAGLCPTTEANLGDGVFPFADYLAAGGRFGIGSDSHVSRDPVEELRWLEYAQRLVRRERNVAASAARPSVGGLLWTAAAAGGAQALGRFGGALRPGAVADLIVLDGEHPDLAGRADDAVLDALVFSGGAAMVRDVMVGGRWRIRAGRHPREEEIGRAYRRAIERLALDD